MPGVLAGGGKRARAHVLSVQRLAPLGRLLRAARRASPGLNVVSRAPAAPFHWAKLVRIMAEQHGLKRELSPVK